MLNLKNLLTKILNNAQFFKGVSSNYTTSSNTTFTPAYDGWLVARATSTVSSGYAPVIRINNNSRITSEGVGVTTNGGALYTGVPCKAGQSYTVTVYRATFDYWTLFY